MIRQLPADVRSYLRSGVAITSVSQCVEELFLNAVDAGANCVAVRVDLDAFKVQVVDNGCGVEEDQLGMLGERYSTSKCHLLTDLDNLCYYGYRGEALASIIDSCGILEVTTRTKMSAKTFCKMFQNSKALKVTESVVPRPSVGTTVTVHDLFQNFPVRRKYTNVSLELERIRQRLEGLALLKPEVSISLRNDLTANVILQTHKCSDIVKTFAYLFGIERAKNLVEVNDSEDKYSVKGYIGKTAYSKKDLQFVYINGRLVLKTKVHKHVNQAMAKSVIFKRSYGQNVNTPEITQRQSLSTSPTKFMDKHPFYVLNIICPLTEYDITFDPAKTLVEFKDWESLLQCVTSLVNSFLKKENLAGSPVIQAATNEDGSPTATQTGFDVIKAASEISPSGMKDVLTSRRVKRQVVDNPQENMLETPKTMSLEEWKAQNESKKSKNINVNETQLSTSASSDGVAHSDRTVDTDTSNMTDTTSDIASSSMNHTAESQSTESGHKTSDGIGERKEEIKVNSVGNRIEEKHHLVSTAHCKVNERNPRASPEGYTNLLGLNKEKSKNGFQDPSDIVTGHMKHSEESSVPSSSLSLYRKAIGKPVSNSSGVTLESSLKKTSSLFADKPPTNSLSSLQRFRKQFGGGAIGVKPEVPSCSGNIDTGPGSSHYSNPFAGIYPKPKLAMHQTSDKASTNTLLTQKPAVQDFNIGNSNRQLPSFDTSEDNIDRKQSSHQESQHVKEKLVTISGRKRMSENKDLPVCQTSAAKLSRLVLEKTSSLNIEPDPSFSGERNFDLWSCVEPNMFKIQTSTRSPCKSSISKQIEMLDRDITALSENIIGHSNGGASGQRNLCHEHFPAQDIFHPSVQHYETTQSTSCGTGISAIAATSSPNSASGATSFDRGKGAYETSLNKDSVRDNGISEEYLSVPSHTDGDGLEKSNEYEYSTAIGNPQQFDYGKSVEDMDTQVVEQPNPDTDGKYFYTAVPLNIKLADTGGSNLGQHDDMVENIHSEPFKVSTQSFSPQLSQSSLNNKMTEINLSQGFTPIGVDCNIAEELSDDWKTPQSEGFSPQLDSLSYGFEPASNTFIDSTLLEGKAVSEINMKKDINKNAQIQSSNSSSGEPLKTFTCQNDSSQNSPNTLEVPVKVLHEIDEIEQKTKTTDNSTNSPNYVIEDITVTQLLKEDSTTSENIALLPCPREQAAKTKFTFSEIFSSSQSDHIKSSLCEQCHSVNSSKDNDTGQEENSDDVNKAAEQDVPNCSWNSTWSSACDNSKIDESGLNTSTTNDTCDTFDATMEPTEFEKQGSVVKKLTNTSEARIETFANVNIDGTGGNNNVRRDSARHLEGVDGKSDIPSEQTWRNEEEVKERVTAKDLGTSVSVPGLWLEITDPVTGKQLFVHSKSGATVYGDSFKGNTTHNTSPVRLDKQFHFAGSVRIKPGAGNEAGSSGETSSSVGGMVKEYLEEEEEDVGIKWRSPNERDKDTVQKETTIDSLFQEWTNPGIECTSKDVLTGEVSGLPSRAVVNAYKSMHTCTFTKEMLKTIQVIGQLDRKFIACLINTKQQTSAKDDTDMLAVIDQHAAHERIRLEMLTEEAYIDGRRDSGQLSLYTVNPPKSMTLTENEVRVMDNYRKEFRRIGIQFEKDVQSRVTVHIKSVPECLVVKGEPGGKRKEDFIYWNTIEAMVKEHVELLCSTQGSKGRLPKVIHKILCSLACHGAIKFGDQLTQVECKALIKDLSTCDLPFQCAHGRPSVMPVLQLEQLETKLPKTKQKKPQLYKLTQAVTAKKDNK